MKTTILAILLSLSFSTQAEEAADYFRRLERMVDAGAITPEAALNEKLHIKSSTNKKLVRGQATRDLASVEPALKPLTIKRYKARPMEFVLD